MQGPLLLMHIDYWRLLITDAYWCIYRRLLSNLICSTGVRLSGIIFNKVTQTCYLCVLAKGRKELFPLVMGSWVNHTTVCRVVGGLLLQFKHHIGTATSEGEGWCWYEPEFPRDLAFKVIIALLLCISYAGSSWIIIKFRGKSTQIENLWVFKTCLKVAFCLAWTVLFG